MNAELLHNNYFNLCNQHIFELFNTFSVVLFILLSSPKEKCIYYVQWRIQGRGPGGPGCPLFLDQTEDRRAGVGEGRGGPELLEDPLNLQNSKFSGNTPWCWALAIVVSFLQCN